MSIKCQTEKQPQHYFFVQKPGKTFEKRFEARYRQIKLQGWELYNQVLLENHGEIKKMKQKMIDFEKTVQDRLDEYD